MPRANLPEPFLMDTWLEGYAAALDSLGYIYPERDALDLLCSAAVAGVRDHAEDEDLYQLRELEIQWGRDTDPDDRRETLRDILRVLRQTRCRAYPTE